MAVIGRSFNGRLNLDVQDYRIPAGDYIDALNITRDAQGVGQDRVVSNVVGNQLVSYSLPSGTNKTIGNFEDKVRNRLYYFIWNSNGYNTIAYYDGITGSIVKVMQDLTDTGNVGILNFDPSYKINHIDIIYRDEGDLLFWTDGLNPPSKINVTTATSGGYGTIIRSFLNVIKEPPEIPPAVVYEDDNTVTVNNLRKKLFKFKYRYVFDDNEKSVWSAPSVVPLPINYTDSAGDSDPTKNARIAMVVQTGESNVKKIEIAAAQSLGSTLSDYFLIQVLNKSDLSISDNDIYTFRFYNNQAYTYVAITESVQPFDYVPQKAYTQALPNGNVLCYAAITEGYDLSSITGTISASSIDQQTTQLPFLFVGSQSGNSGFGTGNIHIKVLGAPAIGDVFNIITTNYTITFTCTVATTTNVINGLSAAAIADGFTVVSSDSENLVISKANEVLQLLTTTPVTRTPTDSFVWDYNSQYNAGVIYFDAEGRTNSVVTNTGLTIQTPNYSEAASIQQIPKISLSITSRPPDWAYYYHIVFTKNTTKSNLLYWVSDRTFKDDDTSTTQYAYISIENLNTFIKSNPNSPLGYTFVSGDRIRFIKVLSGTVNAIYTNKDFEIQASVVNPTINGTEEIGQFIKIFLPTTDSTFDFGTTDFYNYFIEIYTPAQSVANGLDVYYEIGQRYAIGNPGKTNAFHQGMIQNQTPDLMTPATFSFTQGDDYYRIRKINTGAEYDYVIAAGYGLDSSAGRCTLGVNFISQSYNDANILTGSSPLQNLIGFNYATNNDRYLLSIVSGTYTFTVKGSVSIVFDDTRPNDQYEFYLQKSDGTQITLVQPFDSSQAGTYTFDFNVSVTLTAGQKLFILGWSIPDDDHTRHFIQTDLTITRQNPYSVGVVDPNFSDYFASAINSYGRSWVVDANAAQTYYPTLIRNGGEFQQDTSINNINRFYFDTQDTYNRQYGDIRKLFIEGQYLYVWHEFEVGVVPILIQIIQDTAGNPLQANSNTLLNKIQYVYKGKYGIGNVPSSFAFGKWAKFFVDNNKGTVNRLSQDGIVPLSILYSTNAFFVSKLAAFRSDLNNGYAAPGQPYTGNPTVYGVYDAYTNKYIIALEEINRYDVDGNLIFHQDPYTFTFLDARDESEGFETQNSFTPENMGCLNNLLITFKNGEAWTHNSSIFANYYGIQYDCYITVVFNDNPLEKKTWISLTEMANNLWDCPVITTQLNTYGSTPQSSTLVSGNFKQLEGQWHANFLRDANSPGGIINGWALKGNYIVIKFRVQNASNFVFLQGVVTKFIDSPLTNR